MIEVCFDGIVIEILLVEDNAGDARLAQEALREGRFRNGFHHVTDGGGGKIRSIRNAGCIEDE